MKKIKNLIIVFFITFICTGCPKKCKDCHQHITFINNSDEKIICQFRGIREKNISECIIFWDNPFLPIQSNSSGLIECRDIDRNCSWEAELNTLNTNHLIQFQAINDSVYQHYIDLFGFNNDSIQKYVPILHCYQLTLSDLQRMNWTVVYPPEE
jgi:hypothetical protein